jgi:hypothetical protein
MAREKADRGETMSSRSSKKGNDDDSDARSNKYGDFGGGNEAMEPEILLQILNRKSKKWWLVNLIYSDKYIWIIMLKF